MEITYARVHLFLTLPPCLVLFFIHRPLMQSRDVFRFVVLMLIAVVATTPWDSFLIRSGIWAYPPHSILGPTLFQIPLEEYTFFVVQTYLTTTVYTLFNKAVFHPAHLPTQPSRGTRGAVFFSSLAVIGVAMVAKQAEDTYAGLILVWACPFLAFLWYLAGPHLLRLPWYTTVLPIALPTYYLWFVDTFALKRGTWSISSGTKSGIEVWEGLEIEEAIFFLLTNMLLVFGSVAFSHAYALLDVLSLTGTSVGISTDSAEDAAPARFVAPSNPFSAPLKTFWLLFQVLLLSPSDYPTETVGQLHDAAEILRKHSRSFHISSSIFPERCRMLLLAFYSFCRVTDDMVDNAPTPADAEAAVRRLRIFLQLCYPDVEPFSDGRYEGTTYCMPPPFARSPVECDMATFTNELPPGARPSFALFRLLVPILPPAPVYDLLAGYNSDLKFKQFVPRQKGTVLEQVAYPSSGGQPIQTDGDLVLYSRRVAGSVGVACTHLMFAAAGLPAPDRPELYQAASDMGVALQLVNIARDILKDAHDARCYIPVSWHSEGEEPITPSNVLRGPEPFVEKYQPRLVEMAISYCEKSERALSELPEESRLGATVAVTTYMAIGLSLQRPFSEWKGGLRTTLKIAVMLMVLYAPTGSIPKRVPP